MTEFIATTAFRLALAVGSISPAPSDEPVPADSAADTANSVIQADTTRQPAPQTINDSILMLYPNVILDTLTVPQRMLIEFETRYRFRQQKEAPKVKAHAHLSYFDSLTTYYLSPRWNLRDDIDRSFYHDAGDYLKFDPSFFVMEPQVTPLRKTAQPYGLAGDRLGLLIGGKAIHPFEHVVEPDGMIDLNDVPTALDYTVAALQGPVGLVFGADPSVATLLTLPRPLDSTNPRSGLIVDKGAYSYAYTRGRYAKRFIDGRHIDMSIAYRNADGIVAGLDDDSYNYTADLDLPLGSGWDIETDGQLYARSGDYRVRPFDSLVETRGNQLGRNRFDRFARVQLSRLNEARDAKYVFGYRHLRQGSSLSRNYRANLDQTGHALSFSREWVKGAYAWHAELVSEYLQYDNWFDKHSRLTGAALLNLARLSRPWGYAITLKQSHAESFRFLPTAAAMLRRESAKSFLILSLGYTERAPSLNELFLPRREGQLYGHVYSDYVDQGNPHLKSERILEGAAQLSLGKVDNCITLSAAGGKIWDGIDWWPEHIRSETLFSPQRGNVKFGAMTATGRFRLADFFRATSGGSYRKVEYANVDKRPYTPEYQAFSGAELHVFWRQKLIDFWAYGELTYVGPYDGYVQTDLGNRVVTNVQLSFRLGHFRFHWILQNSLSNLEGERDYWIDPGYSGYYGFTWDFFD